MSKIVRINNQDVALALSPQFIQFAASQVIVNDSYVKTFEQSAYATPFGEAKGVPYMDSTGLWWSVDQGFAGQLPPAPTYQNFKTPNLQAFTDSSCAMEDMPGLATPWVPFNPGDQIIATWYIQTWLASNQPNPAARGGIHHYPIGYIAWQFDVRGTVGKDQANTDIKVKNASYNWVDSPGNGNNLYDSILPNPKNYPGFQ